MSKDQMFPATGEVVIELEFIDNERKTRVGQVVRVVEVTEKKTSVKWAARIDDYEFNVVKDTRKEAKQVLEEEIAEIGNRTPAQDKYSKSLRSSLRSIKYARQRIDGFFDISKSDIQDSRQKMIDAEQPSYIVEWAEDVALSMEISKIGVELNKYIVEAEQKYANDIIKFVGRLNELYQYEQKVALQRTVANVLRPSSGFSFDTYRDRALATFADKLHYEIDLIQTEVANIIEAMSALWQAGERPDIKDVFGVSEYFKKETVEA